MVSARKGAGRSNLLFSVKHGEGEDEVVLCGLRVCTRVLDDLNELLELKALISVREAGHLAWSTQYLLLC